jgi:hypothetical protein
MVLRANATLFGRAAQIFCTRFDLIKIDRGALVVPCLSTRKCSSYGSGSISFSYWPFATTPGHVAIEANASLTLTEAILDS